MADNTSFNKTQDQNTEMHGSSSDADSSAAHHDLQEMTANESVAEDSIAKEPLATGPGLEEQLEEWKDKYLRLFAEFDNFKKRWMKERAEFAKMAGRDVILAFLPVLDDFERALKNMEGTQDVESVKEGVQLIFKKFHDTLEKLGVTTPDCSGQLFDPEKHEAVARVPAGPEKSGIILDTVERGFMMHDRVLRFPKVVVGE